MRNFLKKSYDINDKDINSSNENEDKSFSVLSNPEFISISDTYLNSYF